MIITGGVAPERWRRHRVLLYATDPGRAQAMIDAAHKAHPDTGGVAALPGRLPVLPVLGKQGVPA